MQKEDIWHSTSEGDCTLQGSDSRTVRPAGFKNGIPARFRVRNLDNYHFFFFFDCTLQKNATGLIQLVFAKEP